ncbi:MAG: hypothetical protein ACLFV3_03815 [Phycisphaeraceae bacterium]
MRLAAFRLVQGLYYLLLGAWLGALIMLVIAAATAFGVIREFDPTLPAQTWQAAHLADRHSDILAGHVVGTALDRLAWLQGLCAGGALACTLLQGSVFRGYLRGCRFGWRNLLRTSLILFAGVLFALQVAWVNPAVRETRAAIYAEDAPAAERQAAEVEFATWHQMSETLGGATMILLAGTILFSPFCFAAGFPRAASCEHRLS